MEPDIPSGRAARDAWRALSAPARATALRAAKQGVAAPDIGIAWAAAGYGRSMARRYRIITALTPLAVFVLLVVALAVSQVAGGLPVDAVWTAGGLVILGFCATTVVVARRVRRYQRLHGSGLLGIEATQLGLLAAQPSPAVWHTSSHQSEFTVPYEATVPVAAPVTRTAADPVAAGTREIPIRRGPVLVSLGALAVFALFLWLVLGLAASQFGHGDPPLAALPLAVFTLFYTAFLAFLLYAVAPSLRRPLIARFTPSGWELPAARMSGPWAEVREIRVRPLATSRLTGTSPQLVAFRVVALIVDDPARQLAHLSSLRRALVRRTMKKYGSPVVIVASPRRSIPLVELVHLMQRYTDAPVTWG